MGRPIKKKFFGNLIAPYEDYMTGGPTGEGSGNGVASITIGGTNTGYTSLPGVIIDAPTMPTGVQAVATATELTAVDGSIVSSGTGGSNQYYLPGQVLTVVGGTASSAATFDITSVNVRTASAENTGTNYEPGDTFTFSGAGWSTVFTATVATVDGNGSITGLSFTPGDGVFTGTSITVPTTATTVVSASGTDATFNLGFGINSIALADGGTYTAAASNPRTTTVNTGTGIDGTLDVLYGIKTVLVTTTGSGYVVTPNASFSSGTATATPVMVAGLTAGQSLQVTARIINGTSKPSDIMKQESSRRYLVRNSDGNGQCKLVAKSSGTLDEGEMNLIATDTDSYTYYVTKLTARRAVLTRTNPAQGVFETGDVAGWTVTTATTGVVTLATS